MRSRRGGGSQRWARAFRGIGVARLGYDALTFDVLFDSNHAPLQPAGIKALDTIVDMLREHPTYRAELVGHTDARGAAQYNMRLSKQRTMAVAAYLKSQGIAQDRLILAWKGATASIAANTTPAGRAKNRRTDITLRPPSAP